MLVTWNPTDLESCKSCSSCPPLVRDELFLSFLTEDRINRINRIKPVGVRDGGTLRLGNPVILSPLVLEIEPEQFAHFHWRVSCPNFQMLIADSINGLNGIKPVGARDVEPDGLGIL